LLNEHIHKNTLLHFDTDLHTDATVYWGIITIMWA